MSLQLCPIDLEAANIIIKKWHRHHKPVPGCKFCVAATNGTDIVGVAIAGRPVSLALDQKQGIIEVNRCCTDGTRNACSILYGACARTAKGLGYSEIITYTLPEEGGASLKASGWTCEGIIKGTPWNNNVRQRADTHPLGDKYRWSLKLNGNAVIDYRILKETVSDPFPMFESERGEEVGT